MMIPAAASSSSSSWSLMARKDRSTPISISTNTKTKTKTKYEPRGPNQAAYVQYLQQSNTTIVVGTGPAGCGKTLFACCSAVEAMKCGDVQKIILTRPVVSVEEELGFLPGNILRKMDPWLQPLFDIFLEHYTQKELDRMIAEGKIEISPLGFMRGRTFKHCFILADEMQNSSPGQMLMLLTRIGEGSKLAVTGDVNQSDLPAKSTNGLSDFLDKYRKSSSTGATTAVHSYIQWVQMNMNDVERSPVVVQVLSMYEPNSSKKSCTKTTATNSDAALIPASHVSCSSHFPKDPCCKHSTELPK
jgi:phosphate starvation-inducible PhoH-like protein